MKKLIRELRMGLPKTFKTGAIVGTYPKPMIYLLFDREGYSVIPWKAQPSLPTNITMDVTFDEVKIIKPEQIDVYLNAAEQPKVLIVDFTLNQVSDLEQALKPAAFTAPRMAFLDCYNKIATHIRNGKPFPWKTALFDSLSGYESIILNYISSANPGAMADARQWAGMTGGEVKKTIMSMTGWPCHVVFIAHTALDKNEITGTVTEQANVFSKLRDDIGGLFSQYFYATKTSDGRPVIWPHPKMYVRGVGARWPTNLAQEVNPDFKSIYGTEVD